jgi:hypothetical protein
LAEKYRRLIVDFLCALFLVAGLASGVSAQPLGIRAPSWKELPPAEKQVLAPLASDWDQWDVKRKQK